MNTGYVCSHPGSGSCGEWTAYRRKADHGRSPQGVFMSSRHSADHSLVQRWSGASLYLDPCVPRAWPRFEIRFRYRSANYEITVENPHGVSRGVSDAELDGIAVPERPLRIALMDDGTIHRLRLMLG